MGGIHATVMAEAATLWDVVVNPKQMSVSELEEGLLFVYWKIVQTKNYAPKLTELLILETEDLLSKLIH